ncbi:MAG: hypothetical protein JSR70_08535 [Proteobacteria bacterium]|nr:hypothetical protein [Pseudomonadota bacterium]
MTAQDDVLKPQQGGYDVGEFRAMRSAFCDWLCCPLNEIDWEMYGPDFDAYEAGWKAAMSRGGA